MFKFEKARMVQFLIEDYPPLFEILHLHTENKHKSRSNNICHIFLLNLVLKNHAGKSVYIIIHHQIITQMYNRHLLPNAIVYIPNINVIFVLSSTYKLINAPT